MIDVNISIPPQDVAAMNDAFARYVAWFRKGPAEAVKKTCVYIVRSLRASTKTSGKVRRIVKNPAYVKPTNKRTRQLQHIRAWYAGKGKDVPADTADYFNRWAIERLRQRGRASYVPLFLAQTKAEAQRMAKRDRPQSYRILRRGLAKSSWGWMLGKLGKPSMVDQAQISGTTEVTETRTGGEFEYHAVSLANKLGYIRKATKANVGTVLERASKAMVDEMEGHVKGARRASGLRAA